MESPDTLHDLLLLIRSRYGLIHVVTPESERVESLLRHLADQLEIPLFSWSRLEGLGRVDLERPVYDTADPARALDHVRASRQPALYHLHGLGPDLRESARLAQLLTSAAREMELKDGAVVLTGYDLELPPDLERRTARVELPGPGREEFEALLTRILRDMSARRHVEVELTADEKSALVNHLVGLTLMEGEKILTKAIVEDGKLASRDIRHVIEAKKAVVEREGLLEYYPAESGLESVADLKTLKQWLERRKAVVAAPERAEEFGLAFPRGVLLLGVPGCGKSLAAKAVAWEWNLPLLKLDPSNLYNKYVGESERNFKRAMETAERMAPLVLWIDELEKAFATGGSEDGGVSQRILGSFLSWMQERRGDVFVVATANNIDRLPPEFLRKGRFDEIFFVDLPDPDTRSEIFRIHLEIRSKDPSSFDLEGLAEATEGFSGAEIEEVVVSSLYSAFADRSPLTRELLEREIEATRPLSVTMAEKVARIRSWARDRAVLAN
ncbi:MAG: AAA family ATPase [Gemmatimonadota bacterium]